MSSTNPQPEPFSGTHVTANTSQTLALKASPDIVTQESTKILFEAGIKGKGDLERPGLAKGLEVNPTGFNEEDGKILELPVLKLGNVDGGGIKDGGTRNGSGRDEMILLSEIPDSDIASSPFSMEIGNESSGRIEGVELALSTGAVFGEIGARAEFLKDAETEDKAQHATEDAKERPGNVPGGSGGKEDRATVPTSENAEVYTSAELIRDARGEEKRVHKDDTSLPKEETRHPRSLPSDGQNVLRGPETLSTEQTPAIQRSILGDGDFATEEASLAMSTPPKEHAQAQASASTEIVSEDFVNSPIGEAACLESPLGDMDITITKDILPMAKISFLEKALRADEALSVQKKLASTGVMPSKQLSITESLPKEIPPSDDEDATMDEDSDPLTNVFEFHTTHASSPEDPNTFFIYAQTTKESNQPGLVSSSTAEVETLLVGDTSSWKVRVDFIDAPSLSTDASEIIGDTTPVQDSNITKLISSTEAMDVDMNVVDAVAKKQDGPEPIGQPASQDCTPDSNFIATIPAHSEEPPRVNLITTLLSDGEIAETVAFSKVPNEQLIQPSSLLQETEPLVATSPKPKDHDDQVNEIGSSPPRLKGCIVAPVEPIVTSDASFTAPGESQNKRGEDGIPKKLTKTPNASFTVPNESQGKTEGVRTIKKVAGASSVSSKAAKSSPEKDVLFDELKVMKIASIQARNASLEAEIAAKLAKLEEVTEELENPAVETVKRHIKLLHDYNDIRDVGQGLVGMIADNRGVRIGELYEEFGIGLKD